ncbi:carbamoyl-phosphate synthase large subunit [Oceanirhabdus sp. W0125-5]|uniref:carbamoyl-phosphate synthase large subunit n=1 Tax=Oceanirhabdus sp. W0125-5 TaxID=2999116 RepID=UPI0022F2CAD8|nr:carbamoyl-phosphate synthase large subunit [Oceanirhabdus sp. W0125-5]WBW97878.1 carbamoyl-phosphate synthase large subunit [Oceanirhabdus sp. W0125-5]
MPLNKSIKRVLVVGSGPIIIGQAAEFDYSGTQACTALREEGVEVILANSNPATIMTDSEVADKVYIEPLTVEVLGKIIEKERPDSILPGMGGQCALNLVSELYNKGILEKYKVNIIGTEMEGIIRGEDRDEFKKLLIKIGQPAIESTVVNTIEEGIEFANKVGYPLVVRPAYTMGGAGGGIVDNEEELINIASVGLDLSRVGQVLLERSIKGWKEIEYEVVRDGAGNCITVCNMENLDPVGVHTGDSIVVAPSQTISDKEYQMLRRASIDIINEVGIKGACNVQLALNPDSMEYAVIEINPRVSRSSALASKATGYPIAKVAAKIALGYTLDEIKNEVTGKTYACFEPALDYVVTKIPKWPFDKFNTSNRRLGTKMMATGEIMSIGNSFESSFLKGIRSLEVNQYGMKHDKSARLSTEELKARVHTPDDERIFQLCELIRRGITLEELHEITQINMFFLSKLNNIIQEEKKLEETTIDALTKEWLLKLKKYGFSDKGIAGFIGCNPDEIYQKRKEFDIKPSYKMVDTCAGEFKAVSPYYYSTYDEYDEVEISEKRKIMVLGSGPIRIGQGIEFDYCSVHSVLALKEMGIETIIVNNNPETVSTDFNVSDKLYFEPLTEEDVFNIIEKENPEGVIVQFGGQTGIKLTKFLKEKGVNVLGSAPESIHAAEDRDEFEAILDKLNIERPKGIIAWNKIDAMKGIQELGFPALIRPSYVLGGHGMKIANNNEEADVYLSDAFEKARNNSVLIDQYIRGREIEVDAICDGEEILIPGIMEHLERAGVHSGDSITIYPSKNIAQEIKDVILDYTRRLALELNIIGMINIQYIEYKGKVYVIEANPRSSRTVPYISKVTGIPIVSVGTQVMLGKKLKDLIYGTGVYKESKLTCVKVPVFSSQKLDDVEISLSPEMKSTGEVLGVGTTLEEALYKGFLAAGYSMKMKNNRILSTISNDKKDDFVDMLKDINMPEIEYYATEGTNAKLNDCGFNVRQFDHMKLSEILRDRSVDFVVSTATKGNSSERNGFKIRRAAAESYTDIFTSLDTAKAYLNVIKSGLTEEKINVYELDEYGI